MSIVLVTKGKHESVDYAKVFLFPDDECGLDRRVSSLTSAKTYFGWPISWFEITDSYTTADGVVNKDGTLGLPDHGGFIACFRMKKDKRKLANWGG